METIEHRIKLETIKAYTNIPKRVRDIANASTHGEIAHALIPYGLQVPTYTQFRAHYGWNVATRCKTWNDTPTDEHTKLVRDTWKFLLKGLNLAYHHDTAKFEKLVPSGIEKFREQAGHRGAEYPYPGSTATCCRCDKITDDYYHCAECTEYYFDLCAECSDKVYKDGHKVPHATHCYETHRMIPVKMLQ